MRLPCALVLVGFIGCQGDPVGEVEVDAGRDGSTSSGGSGGSAGSTESGGRAGNVGQGGAPAAGGSSGQAGASSGGSGGAPASGGSPGSGGAPASGGSPGSGGAPASGGSSGSGVVVPGPEGARGVAVDDTFVYFGSGRDVWRAPKSGAGSKTLVTTGTISVREVEVSGGDVYFLDGDKTIRRAPSSGGGAALVVQGSGSFERFGDFATDGAWVYYASTLDQSSFAGSISRVRMSGGVPEPINSSADDPRGIALLAGEVYWTQRLSGRLFKAPAGGGDALLLASGLAQPIKVAPGASVIYWTEALGGLAFKRYVGSELTVSASGPGEDVLIDDRNAYFSAPSASRVYGAPLESRSAVVVAECSLPGSLAQDTGAVYVACNGTPGAVLRIAK
jgi:hypothetical protein